MLRLVAVLPLMMVSALASAQTPAAAPAKVTCGVIKPVLADAQAKLGGAQKLSQAAPKLADANPCDLGLRLPSIKTIIGMILKGKPEGGRHLETQTPFGMPSDKMFAGETGVVIDFGGVAPEQIQLFRLNVDGSPLLVTKNAGVRIDVPVMNFNEKNVFQWSITTSKAELRGEFTLVEPAKQAEVQAQLARIEADDSLDDVTKMVYTAAVFNTAHLNADRDRMLLVISRQLRP